MPEPMIRHSCPADGTEHEASADCPCNPAQLSDTEWQHFGNDLTRALFTLGRTLETGAAAFDELRHAMAGASA